MEGSWYTSAVGAQLSWTLPFGVLVMFAVMSRFDRAWEDNPSFPYYYAVKGADTVLHVPESDRPAEDITVGHVKYDDKLMVGYRYWTTTGKHALYPFGYGLSYTTFSFSKLQVPATAAAGSQVKVSFDLPKDATPAARSTSA